METNTPRNLGGWFSLLATVFVLVFLIHPHDAPAAGIRKADEYEIKAAYLYNFLLFTKWPAGLSVAESDLTIGVVGRSPFGDVLDEIEGIQVKDTNKRLTIKRFGPYREGMDLSQCNLLFVSSTERKNFRQILAGLWGRSVLTIADADGFLDEGGIIQLQNVKNKVRWSVNLVAADQSGLKFDSQILRSAIQIIRVPADPG